MRIVFWSGDSTICIPWIDRRANTLVSVRKSWRAALMELSTRLAATPGTPRVSYFEIECHGRSAFLAMPNGGDIDHTNVVEFGTLLKPLLTKGALIEIQACSVASINLNDMSTSLDGLPATTTASGLTQEYWDALEKDQYIEIGHDRQAVDGADVRAARIRWLEQARTRALPIASNGLEFCRALAMASGARVRAASMMQFEFSLRGFAVFDAVGGWEGHVWDFLPSGGVKYIGFNPSRSKPFFAQNQADPRLNFNGRGQGVDNDDGRLRPQRLDRAPLAV